MAVLVYRIRNDSFNFPYPRELVAAFDDSKFQAVSDFVTKMNQNRISEWFTLLTLVRDASFDIARSPEGVKVNPTLRTSSFRLPHEK